MNSRLIKWELKKQQHTYLPIILFCFIIVAVFLGSFLYFMNQKVFSRDQTQLLALWGEIGLFSAQLFFPLLIAVIVNTIWSQELDRHSWYLPSLLPIRGGYLLIAKVIIASFYVLLSQTLLLVLYYTAAITSTSQSTFFGSVLTATQERAGLFTKYFAYTSLNAAKSFMSARKHTVLTAFS